MSQFILSQNELNVSIPDSAAKVLNTSILDPAVNNRDLKKVSTEPSRSTPSPDSDNPVIQNPVADSLHTSVIPDMMVDSLHRDNDTVFDGVQPLYLHFRPNPQTSLWLSFVFPGLGQIYNRKYWKLPIIYGLGVGIGYAISYTNNLYKDYLVGYQSYSSSKPNPSLYKPLIPEGYPESNISSYLKNQMNNYRRYRDLSIVAAVALYALTIVDAFVDAQLSDFDISPDLSMKVQPTVEKVNQESAVGVGMQVNF